MSEENENEKNEIIVKVQKEDSKTETDRELEKFKREAELQEENEDLKEKLNLIVQAQFEKKKRELGCTDAEIDSIDKLEAWEKGRGEQKEESSGSAPLNDAQKYGGSPPPTEGFNSQEEMINELRKDAREGDKDAKRILDAMFLKTIKGVKENERGVKAYRLTKEDESAIETINRQWRDRLIFKRKVRGTRGA
jgi:hypothetical protein